VIIALLKLHLHTEVAAGDGPDERVSFHDARMRGKLRRYISSLLDKDSCHPFANSSLVADPPAPTRGQQPDATGLSAFVNRVG
jgi:hypothetical protein